MMPVNSFDRFLFGFSNIFMIIVPIIVIGGILFIIVSGVKNWSYNNAQPILTVWAKIVSKRANVSNNMNDNDDMHYHSSSTTYYVTFEVESGDRMEFAVMDNEYGMLVEGDTGKLTFQGTRYKGFSRDRGDSVYNRE